MKKIILLLFCGFSFIREADAGVNLLQFAIQGQFLVGGKLSVSSSLPTSFTADFSFTRIGQEYNTVLISLILRTNGTETILAQDSKYDGNWDNTNLWQSQISAIVPAGTTNGQVYLTYRVYHGSIAGAIASSSEYQLIDPQAPPSTTLFNYFSHWYTVQRSYSFGIPVEGLTTPHWSPSSTTPMLTRGQEIYSLNGQYLLAFQAVDGNLVIYKVATGQALWSIQKVGGEYLFFEPDGNLIMFNSANQMIWTSDIYMHATFGEEVREIIRTHAYFEFQDDGNLVMNWNGNTYTDVIGATGTGGGIVSSRFGTIKLP